MHIVSAVGLLETQKPPLGMNREIMATNTTTTTATGASAAAAAARESRRRKIVERGADRLALITGRIQDPPAQSDGNLNSDSSSALPLDSLHQSQDPPPNLTNKAAVSSNGEDEASSSVLADRDLTKDIGHVESNLEPNVGKSAMNIEGSTVPPPCDDASGNINSSFASSTDQMSTISAQDAGQHMELQLNRNKFVTPSEISSAISSSEKSRLFASVTIALLVILSYLGFPILGSRMIKSIVSLRPLYLVVLTNLTLVLARLLFNNQRRFERATQAVPSAGGNDWTQQAGKALESVLLMQKAMDAIFTDCSVYAVIVICGLSFV